MLDYRFYTFLTLSKALNFTKAADELCITQPAVSQHIRYLEHTYGCKLFVHHGNKLALTRQGLILQQCISGMAADEQHAKELMQLVDSKRESLRFGATLTIGEFLLPHMLPYYMKEHPHTHINMSVENTSTLIQQLQQGDIQFAFVEGYFKKSEFYHELLSAQRYIAVRHQAYQLKHEVHCLEDLLAETLIIREKGSGTREILERLLMEQNMDIHDFASTMEIGNINAIVSLVEQQMGITFLYEAAVQKQLQDKTLIPIEINGFPLRHDFSFITLKYTQYLQEYTDFLHQIQNQK